MPYVRDGLCVFKKNPDGSKGKKVGCSKTVEAAKKFLAVKNMRHAGVPERE